MHDNPSSCEPLQLSILDPSNCTFRLALDTSWDGTTYFLCQNLFLLNDNQISVFLMNHIYVSLLDIFVRAVVILIRSAFLTALFEVTAIVL